MVNDKEAVQPGDLVKDLITGFEGIVTYRTTWMHGCDRIAVQPRDLKEGKPLDEEQFDEHRVEIIEKGAVKAVEPDMTLLSNFGMGVKAKDTLTGFEGVVAGITVELSGLISVVIEPDRLDKDKLPIKNRLFDAHRIELIEDKPIPQTKDKTSGKRGGPAPRGESAITGRYD